MVELDSGMFRDVYKIISDRFGAQYKGCVVKVARTPGCVDANRAEFHTWMAVKGTELEPHFCPIRDRSENFEFLVMEKANIENVDYSDVKEVEKNINRNTSLEDSVIHDTLDFKPDNVGIYDGRPVVIDYPWGGNFERIK